MRAAWYERQGPVQDVLVVGLGPAGPELLTQAARDALARIPGRWLRTGRHPAAAAVPDAHTFDDLYDRGDSLEDVYAEIVVALREAGTPLPVNDIWIAACAAAAGASVLTYDAHFRSIRRIGSIILS